MCRHHQDHVPPDQKIAYIVMMMTDLANATLKEGTPCQTPKEFVKRDPFYSVLVAQPKANKSYLLASKATIWQEILRREPNEAIATRRGRSQGPSGKDPSTCYKNKSVLKLMTILAKYPIQGEDTVSYIQQRDAHIRKHFETRWAEEKCAKKADRDNTASGEKTPGAKAQRERPDSAGGFGTYPEPPPDPRHAAPPGNEARRATECAEAAPAGEASLEKDGVATGHPPTWPSVDQHGQHPHKTSGHGPDQLAGKTPAAASWKRPGSAGGTEASRQPRAHLSHVTSSSNTAHDVSFDAYSIEAAAAGLASLAKETVGVTSLTKDTKDATAARHPSPLHPVDRHRQNSDKTTPSSDSFGQHPARHTQSEAGTGERPPVEENTLYRHYRDRIPSNQKIAYIVMMITDLANIVRLKEEQPCQTPLEFAQEDSLFSILLEKKTLPKKALLASVEMIRQEVLRRELNEACSKDGKESSLSPDWKDLGTKYKTMGKPGLTKKLAKHPIKEEESIDFIRKEEARFRTHLKKRLALTKADDGQASQGKTSGSGASRKRSAPAGGAKKSKKTVIDARRNDVLREAASAPDSVTDPVEATFAHLNVQGQALQTQTCHLEMTPREGDGDETTQDFLWATPEKDVTAAGGSEMSSGNDVTAATAVTTPPSEDISAVGHPSPLHSDDQHWQHSNAHPFGQHLAAHTQSEVGTEDRPSLEENTLYRHYRDRIPSDQKMAYIVMMTTDLANMARLKERQPCQTPTKFAQEDPLYSILLEKKAIPKKALLASVEMIWQEILRREPNEAFPKGRQKNSFGPDRKDPGLKYKKIPMARLMSKMAKHPIKEEGTINFIKNEEACFRTYLEKLLVLAEAGDDQALQGKTSEPVASLRQFASVGGSKKSKNTAIDASGNALLMDASSASDGVADSVEAAFAGLDVQGQALRTRKCLLEMKLWEGVNDEKTQRFLCSQIAHHETLLEQIGLQAADLFLGLVDDTEE